MKVSRTLNTPYVVYVILNKVLGRVIQLRNAKGFDTFKLKCNNNAGICS